MINYNPKTWFQLIFKITRNDLLKKISPYLLVMSLYTLCVLWFTFHVLHVKENNTLKNINAVYNILGFVISLLLAFRTNTAYDRWWEGRKALGSLTNTTRMLAIRIASMLPNNQAQKTYFAALLHSFCISLKNKLQGIHDYNSPHALIDNTKQHAPLHVLYQLSEGIETLQKEKHISETQYRTLTPLLNEFSNIVGTCERIKNTPIPYSYSSFIKKFIFIYTFTLPFAWMFNFGYYTILAVSFVFYVLVSLEMLAEEIENPFGTDENDLPFDDICKNIQNNVNEILNVSPLKDKKK